ncbi:MAG: C4-type zinc ribbon domain-containing protein [Acidobacteriota bacterium]
MSSPLQSIVALHHIQTDLRVADARLSTVPDDMRELHEAHGVKQAEIDAARADVEAAAKQVREARAALEDARAKLDKYQSQVSQVTNQREYGALLKEIETVKEAIAEAEAQIAEAGERETEAAESLTMLEASFTELDGRYREGMAAWEADKPAVAAHAETLRAEADALREKIPMGPRRLFERLDERLDGSPVAEILLVQANATNRTYHCAACNYRVRPQVVVQVRNSGEILQCDQCKRILFWQEPPVEVEAEA